MKAKPIRRRLYLILASGPVFFYFTLAVSLMAQKKALPPPHEPLLPKAPEMAAWTVTYEYPEDKSGGKQKSKMAKNRITSVDFEKTGNVYHKVVHQDTGNSTEYWSIDGRELIREDDKSSYLPTPANGPIADNFTKSDFEDLDWLTMKYYVGHEQGARAGFVFRVKRMNRQPTRREKLAIETLNQLRTLSKSAAMQGAMGSSNEDAAAEMVEQPPDGEDIIILDASTQLPIEYDQGVVKWNYRFNTPPTSQLVPPAEVTSVLERWDSFIKASQSSASPP